MKEVRSFCENGSDGAQTVLGSYCRRLAVVRVHGCGEILLRLHHHSLVPPRHQCLVLLRTDGAVKVARHLLHKRCRCAIIVPSLSPSEICFISLPPTAAAVAPSSASFYRSRSYADSKESTSLDDKARLLRCCERVRVVPYYFPNASIKFETTRLLG